MKISLNWSLSPSSPMVMNVGQWSTSGRDEILWEVLDVTLRGKPRSCDIRKALHFKPILWIRRSAATVCPCDLNASWKVCEESAASSTETKTTHRPGKRQVGWLHSQPGLVAPRYGACRTIRSYWRTVVRLDNAGTFCLSEVEHFLVTLKHKNGVCLYSF